MMVPGPLAARPRKTPRRRPSLRPSPELLEDRLAPAVGGALAGLGGPFYLDQIFGVEPPDGDYLLGREVAISGDGQTVAVASTIALDLENGPVGGPYFAGAGSVSVYSRDAQGWSRSAEIPFLDRESADLILTKGVFLSDDGDRMVVVVGSQLSRNPLSLHVLDHSEGGWTTTQVVSVPDGTSMGTVAMSGDGQVIAVGLPYEVNQDSAGSGVVRIYSETDGAWAQSAEIRAPGPVGGGGFGRSIALSGDGLTLVVTGYVAANSPNPPGGVAYIYEKSTMGWDVVDQFSAPGNYGFGATSAISRDGDRLLVSGLGPGDHGPFTAAVMHVYAREASGWRHEAELVSPDLKMSLYDQPAIDEDGDTALVREEDGEAPTDRVLVFRRAGTAWELVQTLSDPAPGSPRGSFGRAVAVHDGLVVVGDDGKIVNRASGSVFFFEEPRSFQVVVSPTDQFARPNTPVWFAAAAAGSEGIATRWQVSDDDGATWREIAQATGPWLVLSPSLADSGNRYRAVFTDGSGATLVSDPASLVVEKAVPVLTIEAAPYRFNEEGLYRVRLASDGSTAATPRGGLVTFRIGSFVATARPVDGVATFTVPARWLAPGVATASALYDGQGDEAFGPGSATIDTAVLRAKTTLTLSLDVAAPHYGQAVRVIAMLAAGAGAFDVAAPSGTVRFVNRASELGIDSLDPYWVGQTSVMGWAGSLADNQVEAEYSGDDWYEPATAEVLVFDAAPAPTELSVHAEPSSHSDYGNSIRYRVHVLSDTRYPASGIVRATVEDERGRVYVVERDVDHLGLVDHFLSLPVGGNKITFEFMPAYESYLPSSATKYHGVWKSPTTVSLTSVPGGTSAAGEEVIFLAQAFKAGTPRGVDAGWIHYYVGEQLVATSRLDESGRGSFRTSALIPGDYTISAVYLESENYRASEPVHLPLRVTTPIEAKRGTVTTVTTSGASTFGDPVAFTATVSAADGGVGPVSGVVAFYIGGALVAYEPLGADGRSTLATTALVPGVYSVAAVFLETDPFFGSLSAPVEQAVRPVPAPQVATRVGLTSTANPSIAGQPLAFIAQVVGSDGALRGASGLVRFSLGPNLIAERPVDAAGRAVLDARFDAAGGYSLVAEYVGDARYGGSRSEPLGQVVLPAATAPPAGQVDPDAGVPPGPEPSRRERLLAEIRQRSAARAAARAEALARRRPPAMRAGR